MTDWDWSADVSASTVIGNKTRVIIIYPTVNPELVIVPIVTSIFVFPIVALLIICCLRKRAAYARQKARKAKRDDPFLSERSNCASMARLSPPSGSVGGTASTSTIQGYGGRKLHQVTDFEMTTTTVDLVLPNS